MRPSLRDIRGSPSQNGAMAKRSWADLSRTQRRLVVVTGALQLGLLTAAQLDIARRPASEIRGSKARWRLITLINFAGPIAYFLRGRTKR